MPELFDALAAALERPRELTAQVIAHLAENFSVEMDMFNEFFSATFPKLEDYEMDLLLSPLFTPTLAEQAVFAGLLGPDSVPAPQWPALVQQLVARPTVAKLIAPDSTMNFVNLREVTIERMVHRLRLEGSIPPPLFDLIRALPSADRPLVQAIARRRVWEEAARRDILTHYLRVRRGTGSQFAADAAELLKLVEIYEPANRQELLARISTWLRVLRQEINESGAAKPFFNERVEELHGGGRDQRRLDNTRVGAKEGEYAFLVRLQLGLTV